MKKIVAMVLMLGLVATSAMAAAKVAVLSILKPFDKTILGKNTRASSRNITRAARRSLTWTWMSCRNQDNFKKQKQGRA
jgi:hypothetical protein